MECPNVGAAPGFQVGSGPGPMILNTHIPSFKAWLQRDHRDTTVRDYVNAVERFVAWLGERELSNETLKDYRWWMQREKEPPLSASSIRANFCALRCFLGWMKRQGQKVPSGKKVQLPTKQQPERRCPTDEEVRRIFVAAGRMPHGSEQKRFRQRLTLAVISILCFTALRIDEVLSLRESDVLCRPDGWRVRVRDGKGGEPAELHLGEGAVGNVALYLQAREDWCRPRRLELPDLWIIDGWRQLGETGMATILRDVQEMAGLERPYTAHCFRRWCGTVVDQEMGITAAQGVLRHKRRETTEIYLARNREREREALDAVSRRIWPELQNGAAASPAEQPTPAPKPNWEHWRQVL